MNYKQTPIDKIPKDWEVVRLGDIAEVKGGKRLPKGEKFSEAKTSYPYIRVVDFKNMNVNTSNLKYLKPETHEKIKNYTISYEDVYISIAGTIGLAGIIPKELNGANLTENAAKLCNLKNVNNLFLAYVLNSAICKRQINAYIGKATQPKLALFRIEKIKIPLPPLPEQKAIAKVLSTVDEAIQKVDESIAKTERLKKGLMQELLTKGIGHKEFKYSKELDCEIPKEWEIVRLNDASTEITDGSHFSPKEDKNGEHRIATVANIRGNQIDIESCKRVSREDYEKLVKNGCKPNLGDILFSKDGTVGLSFSFKQNVDIVLLSSIAIIRPRENLHPDYCAHILKSPYIFRQIIGSKRGTGLRRIILKDLKRIKIPLPPLPEQQKIAEILSMVDKKLELERKRREKLERIKRGLMNDLLTGMKRVNVEKVLNGV